MYQRACYCGEKNRTHGREAFTLIELLVVISIIALLIAILLPALESSRKNAQRIACASNVRQFVIAMSAYATDNHDAYPSLVYGGSQRSWGSYATAAPDSGGNYEAIGYGLLYKMDYLQSFEFFYCPSRDQTSWPALYIFSDNPSYKTDIDGTAYPRATCYNMRGWEPSGDPVNYPFGEGIEGWAVPDRDRRAIVADMFLDWDLAVAAHESGLNVGYSDGSTKYIQFNLPFTSTLSFGEQLAAFGSLSTVEHHEIYRFFDAQ